jgi:hypothetical protein
MLASIPQATAQADDYDPKSLEACLANRPGSVVLADVTDGPDTVCIPWGLYVYDPTPGDRYYEGAQYDAPLYLIDLPGGTEAREYTPPSYDLPADELTPPQATPETIVPDEPTSVSAVAVDSGTASAAAFVTFARTSSGPVAVVRHARVVGAKGYVTRCGTRVVRSRTLSARIHARRGSVCRVRAYNSVGSSAWSKRVTVRQARRSATV